MVLTTFKYMIPKEMIFEKSTVRFHSAIITVYFSNLDFWHECESVATHVDDLSHWSQSRARWREMLTYQQNLQGHILIQNPIVISRAQALGDKSKLKVDKKIIASFYKSNHHSALTQSFNIFLFKKNAVNCKPFNYHEGVVNSQKSNETKHGKIISFP